MHKSVLVVDDVALSREIIKNAISGSDERVKVNLVENAYAAVHKMRSKNYDLVIMDIMMPNGDGFELLEMLSQLAISTKVIVISSLDSAVIDMMLAIGKLFDLDILAALEKPFDSKALAGLVSDVLFESNPDTNKVSNDAVEVGDVHFPIGVFYQPQMDTMTNEIVGVDVQANWVNTQKSLLLSALILPSAKTLVDRRRFNQIVIGKFFDEYQTHLQYLVAPLGFTLHVHEGFIDDTTIYEQLIQLPIMNPAHRFSLFLDTIASLENKEVLEKYKRLTEVGYTLITGAQDLTAALLEKADAFQISEIVINTPPSSVTHSSALGTQSVEETALEILTRLGVNDGLTVSCNGVEDKISSAQLKSKGVVKQQGVLFSGPIRVMELLSFVKNRSKQVSTA
ncbi:response regulator [Vibrio owensii]|uniref:EAL domain-containing response regulator n=1 Tax=Vibrio owensii TaxID=696485 RepID=UPI003AAD586F